MVALPLALTAEYEPPMDGEFAQVCVYLNGQPLLRIVSDDPVADSHLREQHAIRIAIRRVLRVALQDVNDVEVVA
jgi:hypothetical protein